MLKGGCGAGEIGEQDTRGERVWGTCLEMSEWRARNGGKMLWLKLKNLEGPTRETFFKHWTTFFFPNSITLSNFLWSHFLFINFFRTFSR